MGKRKISRSGMLLMELMLAILIFFLAAAVCIQVFVKAHDLSRRAQDLAWGVNCCASAAEILRTGQSREEGLSRLQEYYPQLQQQPDSAAAALEQGSLDIRWQESQGLTVYTITCLDSRQRQIYALELVCPEGGTQ